MHTHVNRFSTGSCLLFCLLVFIGHPLAQAQGATELTPFAGWMFGGSASVAPGTVSYDDAMFYGLILGQKVEQNINVEFSYSFRSTKGHFEPSAGSSAPSNTLDVTIHSLQFGAAYHALTDNVQPFLGTGCGVVWFHPGDSRYSGDWRIALSASVGVKIFPVQNLGIRLQARILLPIYFSSGGFWSEVEGMEAGFHGGFPLLQTDLGVGLIAAF